MTNIDDNMVERASGVHSRTIVIAPWLRFAIPLAICAAIGLIGLTMRPNIGSGEIAPRIAAVESSGSSVTEYGSSSTSGAVVDGTSGANADVIPDTVAGGLNDSGTAPTTESCYADPDAWRGLPRSTDAPTARAAGIIGSAPVYAADREVFHTIAELAARADCWIVVPNVRSSLSNSQPANVRTSLAEVAEQIGGGELLWRVVNDVPYLSTGESVNITQELIGGCSGLEYNKLLREGGVYLLPIALSADQGAYAVVGTYDVLFELDDAGLIDTHSNPEMTPELSKYDGQAFSVLLNDVRALYAETCSGLPTAENDKE